jgi:Tol biopolymer transport system component
MVRTVQPGSRLGPYEIVAQIGAGGMGEVYRARDTRLGRDVAIKVLPAEFASDSDRLHRFEQEARTVAALNHPNILALFDIGTHEGVPYLVTELLEGESLRQRLAGFPLPPRKAMELAVQVATGLAAAHEKGVVHRDIKPENLFVTRDGHVKILDFGIAKLGAPRTREKLSKITTLVEVTERGAILGTAGYMSPEQVRGQPADPRSDLFALGVVLYEMVTGRQAFARDTASETMTAILKEEPPEPSTIEAAVPPALSRTIAHCLEKSLAERFQSARDLAFDLKAILADTGGARTGPALTAGAPRTSRLWFAAAGAAAVVVAIAAVLWLHGTPARRQGGLVGGGRLTMLFSTPDAVLFPALSGDGKMLAYVLQQGVRTDLYVTRVAGGARIRLTNDEAREGTPQFSPDGDRLLFTRFSPGGETPEICIIPTLGGDVTPVLAGASRAVWSPDGTRLACLLLRPPEPEAAAIVGTDGQGLRVLLRADSVYPFFRGLAWSPDGSALAVARSTGGMASEIWTIGIADGKARRLWADPPGVFSSYPSFVADGSGLVYVSNRGGAVNLWFTPLGGGAPVQLTSGAGPDLQPSVARNGTMAFMNTHDRYGVWVYDLPSATRRELVSHSSPLWAPVFAPDGEDIAYSRAEADGSWHVWIVPAVGGESRRLTNSPLPEIYPRFSPDGKWVLYCTWSPQPDRIWRVARRGGPAEPLTPERKENDQYADLSPDGRWLAFARTEDGETRVVVQQLGYPEVHRVTKGASTLPHWSPDGRWIAFSPDRSDYSGVFVIRPDGRDQRQVTATGGWPVWWPDGTRLAYQVLGFDNQQRVRVVSLKSQPENAPPNLPVTAPNAPFDISRDGRSIVIGDSVVLASEIWLLEPTR